MLTIADIGPLTTQLSLGAGGAARAHEVGREFDAMVLEVFLRQSGLMHALTSESDASMPLVSEMFLRDLAKNLAAQMNLGFGSMILDQSLQGERP